MSPTYDSLGTLCFILIFQLQINQKVMYRENVFLFFLNSNPRNFNWDAKENPPIKHSVKERISFLARPLVTRSCNFASLHLLTKAISRDLLLLCQPPPGESKSMASLSTGMSLQSGHNVRHIHLHKAPYRLFGGRKRSYLFIRTLLFQISFLLNIYIYICLL